jgi:DNA-binding winged helix-turn-helix (wHTH) protein/predicted ATPase
LGNEKQIVFDPFRLDLANERLWRGSQAIKLRPKAFAVLDYVLTHPGQLVTKEELLDAVWPGTFVGEAVLKVAIRQIREALGDDPASPRFIETAHRRGYRFIGQIEASRETTPQDVGISSTARILSDPARHRADSAQTVVGRDAPLSRMRTLLDKMLRGERQIVFVTGEAGIGKTALVDTFARSIASDRNMRVVRGQCLEQYGTGEAYLPVLEAIGRLCREHTQAADVLRAHAPMWLLQMPSLVSASDRESLSREVSGATRERMLREMGDALEALTTDRPLVLILEDLHWSDYSTLDLISYLARQRQPAQLMLIGTYRTVELIVSGHPLKAVKQELRAKQQCEELPLEYLSKEAVARYLNVRFPDNTFPAELSGLIHDRTEGSPLFMVSAVDYLSAEGSIAESEGRSELVVGIEKVEVGVPDSIKQMIEKQIDHLAPEEQRMLEAASAAGAEFSAASVAAALEIHRSTIDAQCDGLARRRQFIRDCGIQDASDGEAVTRYGFIHALYQNVLYERVSASRRVQLHRRIGEQGESLYGERAREIAAELAMHFERGANYKKAAKYLHQAAENDLYRFAYREAVGLSRRGLEFVGRLPDVPERAQQELQLHVTLGVPLIATEGYAAADVGNTYTRARELCRQLGETTEISQVLWGLWTFYLVRAELGTARDIAQEFVGLAEQLPYSRLAMEVTLMHLGEFDSALEHAEQALLLYDPLRHRDEALRYSQNAAVGTLSHAAWTLWYLGKPDQALRRIEQALSLASDLKAPHGLAHVLFFAAVLHQLRREGDRAQECADAAIAIAVEHGLLMYEALTTVARGWALIGQGRQAEALEQLQHGLDGQRATGTELLRPHFLALFAEALHQAGKTDEALGVLEEALAAVSGSRERYYEPEIYRLKGELLLSLSITSARREAEGEAETCFQQSIDIAQQQSSKSLQLRAAMSLARLYQKDGRQEEAHGTLAQIYETFTEGFDTPDLREATALLAQLS